MLRQPRPEREHGDQPRSRRRQRAPVAAGRSSVAQSAVRAACSDVATCVWPARGGTTPLYAACFKGRAGDAALARRCQPGSEPWTLTSTLTWPAPQKQARDAERRGERACRGNPSPAPAPNTNPSPSPRPNPNPRVAEALTLTPDNPTRPNVALALAITLARRCRGEQPRAPVPTTHCDARATQADRHTWVGGVASSSTTRAYHQ